MPIVPVSDVLSKQTPTQHLHRLDGSESPLSVFIRSFSAFRAVAAETSCALLLRARTWRLTWLTSCSRPCAQVLLYLLAPDSHTIQAVEPGLFRQYMAAYFAESDQLFTYERRNALLCALTLG